MIQKSKFSADLKAKLDAAGFTEQEQILGTMTAEFKAGLGLLRAARGEPPLLLMATMALSGTFSKLLAYVTKDKDLAMKVVTVSDMVFEAAYGQAATDCPIHGSAGCPDDEQSGEQPRPSGAPHLSIVRLDGAGPTDAKDIN